MGKSAGILILGALLSRMSGFARDASFAWLLGGNGDAFAAAVRLPFMARRLYGEGTLSLALTSTCVKENLHSGQGIQLAQKAGHRMALVTGACVVLLIFQASWLVPLFVPGMHAETLAQAVQLFRITLPYLFFVICAAGCMAALHSREKFLLPALTPLLFNIIVLLAACLAWFFGDNAAFWLAGGIVIGGLCQWLLQIPAMHTLQKKAEGIRELDIEKVKRISKRIPSTICGAAMPQIAFLLAAGIASLQAGHIAALFYAERLLEFPLGVTGAALGMAAAPEIAHASCIRDHVTLQKTTARALFLTSVLAIPAAGGLAAIADPLVRVLFMHGAFDVEMAAMTAAALSAYAAGLPAYALSRPLLAACFALDKSAMPACLIGCGACLICSLILLLYLPHDLAIIAPATGVSAGLWIYVLMLWLNLREIHAGKDNDAMHVAFSRKSIFWQSIAALVVFAVAHTMQSVCRNQVYGMLAAIAVAIVAWIGLLACSGEYRKILHMLRET